MARPSLRPSLADLADLADLVADKRAGSALVAGMAALFASGMDPKVLAPSALTTQALIRAQPEIEGQILLVSVVTAILLLVGGVVGTLRRPSGSSRLAALNELPIGAAQMLTWLVGPPQARDMIAEGAPLGIRWASAARRRRSAVPTVPWRTGSPRRTSSTRRCWSRTTAARASGRSCRSGRRGHGSVAGLTIRVRHRGPPGVSPRAHASPSR